MNYREDFRIGECCTGVTSGTMKLTLYGKKGKGLTVPRHRSLGSNRQIATTSFDFSELID